MPDLGRPVQAVSMAVTNLVKVSVYSETAQIVKYWKLLFTFYLILFYIIK